jgi:hypothetical protein
VDIGARPGIGRTSVYRVLADAKVACSNMG